MDEFEQTKNHYERLVDVTDHAQDVERELRQKTVELHELRHKADGLYEAVRSVIASAEPVQGWHEIDNSHFNALLAAAYQYSGLSQ